KHDYATIKAKNVIRLLAISRDYVAVADSSHTVEVWRLTDGKLHYRVRCQDKVEQLAISDDGKVMVLLTQATGGRLIHLLDRTELPLATASLLGAHSDLAFLQENSLVAIVYRHCLLIFDVATGAVKKQYAIEDNSRVIFSSQGSSAALRSRGD